MGLERTMRVKVQRGWQLNECGVKGTCRSVGDTQRKRPGGLSAIFLFSYLSGSQKTFPAVLPVNGAWLKTGRSKQSKEPVSTRSCAREQMKCLSCPETPPTPSRLPKPWPCLVITPMCQASEPNPDTIQQPLVLRSDLLDSSRR